MIPDVGVMAGRELPAEYVASFIVSPGVQTVKFWGVAIGQTYIGVFRRVMDGDDA